MNAKRARSESEYNASMKCINWILDLIKVEVNCGNTTCIVYGNVSEEEIVKLKELGYNVKSENHKNVFKLSSIIKHTTVSW